jgi:Zn-dependent protease
VSLEDVRESFDDDRDGDFNGILNLFFALFFYALFLIAPWNSFYEILAILGFGLNVGLGSFNMLPFPPLDGYKIFSKSPHWLGYRSPSLGDFSLLLLLIASHSILD